METEARYTEQEMETDGGNCVVVLIESSCSRATLVTPSNVPSTSFPNDKTLYICDMIETVMDHHGAMTSI